MSVVISWAGGGSRAHLDCVCLAGGRVLTGVWCFVFDG